ncbi:MAG: hypothetical protein BAJALOKI1v1_1360009 [Promethearchaeota archaeon]|nr:MAG: hypothetical protein BAJALOKI1v1_1360009 [Candidatus Lokiarchaeota archaeon]
MRRMNSEKIIEFRGAKIIAKEAKMLEQIEQSVNKKFKREYFHVNTMTHFGFREFNDHVSQIGIKDSTLQNLPECMKELTSLTMLLLINNELVEIPEFMGEFRKLEYLYMPSNQIKSIPKVLCGLMNLKELQLNRNQIEKIPSCICSMKALENLSLMENKITQIPECIGDLTTLKGIELRNNNITTLPKSLLEIPSLEVISLKNNPLFTNIEKETEQIIEALREKGVQLESYSSQMLDAINDFRKIMQG